MLNITLSRAGGECALSCSGHAAGRADACAAVSALAQTLQSWLRRRGTPMTEERMAPGLARLRFPGAGCGEVWDFLRLALRGIEAAAPEAVRVKEALSLGQFGEDAGGDGCAEPVGAIHESPADAPCERADPNAPADPVGAIHESPADAPCERADPNARTDLVGAIHESPVDAKRAVGDAGPYERTDPAPARAAARTLSRWADEAEALAARLPGFDLGEAAADPRFRALLGCGFSVEEAFCAAHAGDLALACARRGAADAEQRLMADIRARGARPEENGTSGGSAFTLREESPRSTRAGRAEIARRVARGERVTF